MLKAWGSSHWELHVPSPRGNMIFPFLCIHHLRQQLHTVWHTNLAKPQCAADWFPHSGHRINAFTEELQPLSMELLQAQQINQQQALPWLCVHVHALAVHFNSEVSRSGHFKFPLGKEKNKLWTKYLIAEWMSSLKIINTAFTCYQISLYLEPLLTKQPLLGIFFSSLKKRTNSTSKSLAINSVTPARVLWLASLTKSGFTAKQCLCRGSLEGYRGQDKALSIFTYKKASSGLPSCKGTDSAASRTTAFVFHSLMLHPSKSLQKQHGPNSFCIKWERCYLAWGACS